MTESEIYRKLMLSQMAYDGYVTGWAIEFFNKAWPVIYRPCGADIKTMAEYANYSHSSAMRFVRQLTSFEYMDRLDYRCWMVNTSAIKDPILTTILKNALVKRNNSCFEMER